MATLTKAPRKKRVRFTMDINFSSAAEKDAFCGRLSSVRDLLTPTGSQTLNNYELLTANGSAVLKGSRLQISCSSTTALQISL